MTTTRREALAAMGAAALGGWLALSGDPVEASVTAPGQERDVPELRPYMLPPLPYPYDALEPHLDEQTMRLHHDIHHLGYIKGFERAMNLLGQARKSRDFRHVKHLSREVAFHGSGHFLHSLFWKNMAPDGGGEPKAKDKVLNAMLQRDFGSFATFRRHFATAAAKVEGSGWGILAYDPLGRQLLVLQAEKHQNLSHWGCVPLLVLDVWEHAYYLRYQNRRSAYVEAFFNVINWEDVSQRLEKAISTPL